MVVAVAEDSRGAQHARPWIEQAKAGYWCLIDPEHRVASLYGMANVPRAVWIDELGRIVRPAETAGSTDHFRRMDPKTLTMSPADQAARDAGKAFYVNAVKEWVTTGRHALEAGGAREKLRRIRADSGVAEGPCGLGGWLRSWGWACGCAATAPRRRGVAIWQTPLGCIPNRGTCGASRPISSRSATQWGRGSGHACKRWVTGRITSLPICPASRRRPN